MDYSSIASSISEMEKLLDSDPSNFPILRMSMKNNLQLMLLFFKQSQDTIISSQNTIEELKSLITAMAAQMANKNITIKKQNSTIFIGKESEKNKHNSTDANPDEPRKAKATKKAKPATIESSVEYHYFNHNGQLITKEQADALKGQKVYKNDHAFIIEGFFQTGKKQELVIGIKTVIGMKPTLKPVDANSTETWQVIVPEFDFLKKTPMSAKLFAYVSYLRFSNKMPLNRISEHLKNQGFSFTRQSLAEYFITTDYLLRPIVRYLTKRIVASPWIGVDETFFKSHDKGATGKTNRTYLVGITSDIGVIFYYTDSRGTDTAKQILIDNNISRNTFVITDGLYKIDWNKLAVILGIDENGQEIKEIIILFEHGLCWVHAKRYFCNVSNFLGDNNKPTKSTVTHNWEQDLESAIDIQERISLIFKTDNDVRKKAKNEQEILSYRASEVKPLVDKLYDDYQKVYDDMTAIKKENKAEKKANKGTELELLKKDTKAGKYSNLYISAVTYLFKNKENLKSFLTNPNGILHNNEIEGMFNDIAVLRKSMLATSTMRGGEALATVYSLYQTCKKHNVNIEEYLAKVYLKMVEHSAKIKIEIADQKRYISDEIPDEVLEEMMPWNFAKS